MCLLTTRGATSGGWGQPSYNFCKGGGKGEFNTSALHVRIKEMLTVRLKTLNIAIFPKEIFVLFIFLNPQLIENDDKKVRK